MRLLGLEYGLRRVQEASGLIRIGLELELVGRGVGGYFGYVSRFSSGKYISRLLIGIREKLIWKIKVFCFFVQTIKLCSKRTPNVF